MPRQAADWGADYFLTFDEGQKKMAKAVGLTVKKLMPPREPPFDFMTRCASSRYCSPCCPLHSTLTTLASPKKRRLRLHAKVRETLLCVSQLVQLQAQNTPLFCVVNHEFQTGRLLPRV